MNSVVPRQVKNVSDLSMALLLPILLAGLFSGFGKTTGLSVLGIFTVTMLSLLFPAKEAVGILLPILLIGDLIAVTYYRHTVVWKYLFSLVPWILVGILLGYFVLLNVDNDQLKILLGYLVISLNLFQIVTRFDRQEDGSGIAQFSLVHRNDWNIGRFRYYDRKCCGGCNGGIFVIASAAKK